MIVGIIPNTTSNMIPGMRKLLNGVCSNNEIGMFIKSPLGSMTNTLPPKIAPTPKNSCKKIRSLQENGILLELGSISSALSHFETIKILI